MNRHKRFILIMVIIVFMPFILISWAVSVEASGSELISLTPTPTGTPVGTNNGQTGEILSAEEQTELKSIVQSYIEMRYQALSVSNADDFKQNGFGNLMAETARAKVFLREEMGKMAVEIKHAQLNHLRYVNYEVILDFHSITVDPAAQTATILVSERNSVTFELSEEANPDNPLVSHSSGIEHTILLQKEQRQWKVVSDYYNDDLWKMLRQKGKSTDEILSVTDEILSTMKAAPRPATGANIVETISAIPDDPSSHAYVRAYTDANRASAVKYALDHWSKTNNLYNPDYFEFPGTDCQNFVSQALYEGGNASMFISPWSTQPLGVGDAGWFYFNASQYAAGWTEVDYFYRRITLTADHETWDYGEGPEGIDITLPINEQVPAGLMLGDVIQYDWGKDGTWDHSAIVTDFVGGIPYVAAHTTDHDKVPYVLQPDTNYRFIHIVRSNGNSPVKAKILLSSDDAGTNPTGCGFSSTDNEVYLGACFGAGDITSGFRFTNIQIPQYAQIQYAYVNFTVDGTYTDPLSLNIYGEDTGNSITFTTLSTPANRSTPYSPILWSVNDQWELGQRRTSPELSSVIQNIVNRSDWINGNSLSVIVKNAGSNVRRVIAYERASSDPNLSPAKILSTYTVNTTQLSSNSVAPKDGWILESSQSSGIGGSTNSNAKTFYVGDDDLNKQYRSVLHFDTSGIPDTAIIISAVLEIKQQSITGTNPFTTHGNLVADIKEPYFGTSANLANSDFENIPNLSEVAMFDSSPDSNGWYSAIIDSTGFPYINLTGTTQFRLAFTLGDNNDFGSDYIVFSSGNDKANAPQLIINYYVPVP